MSGKGTGLEKWLSSFFDRVDSIDLAKGQQLFQNHRLFGFQEGGSEVEAMVNDTQVSKVSIYYEKDDLTELGLPDPKKLFCHCTCSEDTDVCEHSVCVVLHWAFQTEKALRHLVEPKKAARKRGAIDLTLKRLESAAQTTPGPFDHLLRGFNGPSHPLDSFMKDVFKQLMKEKRG
ncbi:hypothetical protein PU629_20140 [Pullulanibacillus sp. KACC 23026]|uniref:hypothetical protein n=1 Tax=Pullulanibacillus sp. KACC 23026 TaxID=3028315 RepID=UPI0023B19710|nr:hypothetical protein [Pullulanibacillus sp. KACC 23026]WEG12379.1 hypothetical protein PU629_20140 [Pullulanibacillus sp. KACC 23026]